MTITPTRYRTKLVEIEAIKYDGTDDCADYIIDWASKFGFQITRSPHPINGNDLFVKTLESEEQRIRVGAYVVKGLKNEFYPSDADVFEMKYEPTDPVKQ